MKQNEANPFAGQMQLRLNEEGLMRRNQHQRIRNRD